jgi:hypothetical protein
VWVGDVNSVPLKFLFRGFRRCTRTKDQARPGRPRRKQRSGEGPGARQAWAARRPAPAMANMMAKADELRNALARVDRNGDGLLNFDEFKRGLRGLGVQLPDQELVKIWHEASSQEVGKPAGRPTFQGPLPGDEPPQHSIRNACRCPRARRAGAICPGIGRGSTHLWHHLAWQVLMRRCRAAPKKS